MSITEIGWIIIVFAGICFFWKPSWLLFATIAMTPFTATAVINVGHEGSGSGLQPSIFLGTCYILREGWSRLLVALKNKQLRYWSLVGCFGLVVCASLSMPLLINGSMLLQSDRLTESAVRPLYLQSYHFVRLGYLLFGIAFCGAAAAAFRDALVLGKALWSFELGALFASLWGWVQWCLSRVGVEYPAFLFNNSNNPYATGYTAASYADLAVKRISSVGTEPAIFTQSLLAVLPFIMYRTVLANGRGRILGALSVLVVISGILLSISSSGYFGLLMLIVLGVGFGWMTGEIRMGGTLLLAVVCAVGLFVLFTIGLKDEWVSVISIGEKLQSYSGVERRTSISLAWGYFREYPFLGLGWGTVTSHDLVVNLLSNCGILGTLSFFVAIGLIISCLFSIVRRTVLSPRLRFLSLLAVACILSLLVSLSVMAITGFTYVFSHFWVILAFAVRMCSEPVTEVLGRGRDTR